MILLRHQTGLSAPAAGEGGSGGGGPGFSSGCAGALPGDATSCEPVTGARRAVGRSGISGIATPVIAERARIHRRRHSCTMASSPVIARTIATA
ncbi:hypothetical protein [Streptosporangium sandarakinum]|uniref:hypothetical protein n=1 Tax=Streptosporangium sandarakinum TaxID=1260955 RepID=UPI003423C154